MYSSQYRCPKCWPLHSRQYCGWPAASSSLAEMVAAKTIRRTRPGEDQSWDVHSLMLSSDMLQPPGLVLALVSTGASFFMQWKCKMENGGWLNISVFLGPINVKWLNGCKIFTHAKALWPTFKLMRRVTCKRSVRSVVHGVRADADDCVGVFRLPVKSGQLSVPTCCGCCC